jgi:hypothetical protein
MAPHKVSLCMVLGVLLENKRGKVHLVLNTKTQCVANNWS